MLDYEHLLKLRLLDYEEISGEISECSIVALIISITTERILG